MIKHSGIICFLVFSIIFTFTSRISAQDSLKFKQETGFYFSWGYNKDYFSKSDIHFKDSGNDQYDLN